MFNPSPRPHPLLSAVLLWTALLLSAATAAAQAPAWPDISAAGAPAGDGRHDAAVIVGIEDYAFVPKVEGATRNAQDWFVWLRQSRNVPLKQIRLLRDKQGTVEEMHKAVVDMSARVGPGGVLWFIFIGHGAPAADGKDGVLVGMDVQQTPLSLYARSLPRKTLLDTIHRHSRARAMVVLDACFSGRTNATTPLIEGLQPLLPTAAAPPSERVTLLTAARGDQFAGPLPGERRPAFSYLVLGALRGWADGAVSPDGRDGVVSAEEVWTYTFETMTALESVTRRQQSPELSGDGTLRLATVTAEPAPDLDAFVLGKATPKAPAVAARPEPPAEKAPKEGAGGLNTNRINGLPQAAEPSVAPKTPEPPKAARTPATAVTPRTEPAKRTAANTPKTPATATPEPEPRKIVVTNRLTTVFSNFSSSLVRDGQAELPCKPTPAQFQTGACTLVAPSNGPATLHVGPDGAWGKVPVVLSDTTKSIDIEDENYIGRVWSGTGTTVGGMALLVGGIGVAVKAIQGCEVDPRAPSLAADCEDTRLGYYITTGVGASILAVSLPFLILNYDESFVLVGPGGAPTSAGPVVGTWSIQLAPTLGGGVVGASLDF